MVIQGNLATYELSDLLQWLAQGRKTGTLAVRNGSSENRLGFDKGRIVTSASNDPSRRLDCYLLEKGVIDEATQKRAARLQEATKMMSGQVLVTLGAMTEDDLVRALESRTQEILCELLTWPEGEFEFLGGEIDYSTMVPVSLDVTNLLLESAHRLDEEQQTSEIEVVAEDDPPAEEADAPAPKPKRKRRKEITEVGLALAEILDPDKRMDGEDSSAAKETEEDTSSLYPYYSGASKGKSGKARRFAPLAFALLVGLVAGGYFVFNGDEGETADEPYEAPLVSEAGLGPAMFVAPAQADELLPQEQDGEAEIQEPAIEAPELEGTAEPAEADAESEEALRSQYEEELAALRRQLATAKQESANKDRQLKALAQRPPIQPAASRVAADTGRETRPDPENRRPAAEPERTAKPETTALRSSPPDRSVQPPTSGPAPTPAVAEPEPVTGSAGREAEPGTTTESASQTAAANTIPDEEPAAVFDDPVSIAPEVTPPSLLRRPVPRYPPAARRLQRSATVTLRVLVDEQGKAVRVERLGDRVGLGMDQAAEEAARRSSWRPGTRDGTPTEMWVELRIQFTP